MINPNKHRRREGLAIDGQGVNSATLMPRVVRLRCSMFGRIP